MNDILKALEGKKTYIVGAALALLAFCYLMKWISFEELIACQAALNGAGISTLRAGIGVGK